MDKKQTAMLTAWLVQAEKGFALCAQLFEELSTDDERLTRAARTSREFESQAAQLRAAIMTPASDEVM